MWVVTSRFKSDVNFFIWCELTFFISYISFHGIQTQPPAEISFIYEQKSKMNSIYYEIKQITHVRA